MTRLYLLLALVGALGVPLKAWPADAPKPVAGIAYSPSNLATRADVDAEIPADVIRGDLAVLAGLTSRVRVYATSRGADVVLSEARKLGLKVSLGIALSPDLEANDGEIARAISEAHEYRGTVDRIFVGNEARLRNDVSTGVLIGYIMRIKAAVAGKGIAVGTGELWKAWYEERELGEACDFIGAHIYAYWDGVPLEHAVAYSVARYDDLRAAYPGKPIVIAEIGWPSAGAARDGAVPSAAAQEEFTREFLRVARREHYDFYLFEAFDQPWKVGKEGEVGQHWGLFDTQRRAKFPLR